MARAPFSNKQVQQFSHFGWQHPADQKSFYMRAARQDIQN